jgi:thiamine-monophosphate kinase
MPLSSSRSDSTTGEFGLIGWIRAREAGRTGARTRMGIGDDCAILAPTVGDLLVTTDMLMEGRHFRLAEDGPEAVGYKCFGVNLSDIAAMAGVPRAAVVAVALPRAGAVDIAHGLHAGMRRLSEQFAVDLIGGDTNAWDGPLVVTVTVLGETTQKGAVQRSGARPGDVIFVTGPLGGSLHSGRHLHPEPRIAEALALHQIVDIHAMIDISDGISSDLTHILKESGGLGAELEASTIPIHQDAIAMSTQDGKSALEHALHDGEDFELCFTVSAEDAEKLQACAPPPAKLHRVGFIGKLPGLRVKFEDGRIETVKPRGFDHLGCSK